MPRKTKKDDPGVNAAAVQPALGGSDKSPHKVWTGMLSFGLISMPVSMFTAATEERISFNQLHKNCQSRIKQKTFCPTCDKDIPKTDLIKGYEYEKDKYVVVSEAELDAAEPESAKILKLTEFVPASEIDAIFYESTYYLAAQEGGQTAYALIRAAMLKQKVVGVARIVRSGKEHICVLRPFHDGMILQTLYWNDEVRRMAFPGLPQTNDQELVIAEQLVQALIKHWDPSQYNDAYRDGVMKLLRSKQNGTDFVATPKPAQKAAVVDIAEALRLSLAQAKAAPGAA
jgi:DNA end-binding protein Ku